MFWESVLDDVLLEALFLGLCSGRQSVDDVLVEALFVGLCYVTARLQKSQYIHETVHNPETFKTDT